MHTEVTADNSLATERTFRITVQEVNAAPQLPTLAEQRASTGRAWRMQIAAADADEPPNQLRYSLASPTTAIIDANAGEIVWTPVDADNTMSHRFAVTVTDNGQPPLQTQQTFDVYVGLPAGTLSTNSIGMKFALIPRGEFLMGSPEDEEGRVGDENQHRVRISSDFLMAVYELTQSEFVRLVGRNPSRFDSEPDSRRRAVEHVRWFDAISAANRLSELENLPPYYAITDIERESNRSISKATVTIRGGNGYRLPTEAEWEYAARSGTTTRFFHGDDESGLTEYAWCWSNYSGSRTTFPVGMKKPNAWGLHDTSGNVPEWCFDAYDEGFYQRESGLATDPRNDGNGSSPRVVRSSYHNGSAVGARCANRMARPVNFGSIGVRFARTP